MCYSHARTLIHIIALQRTASAHRKRTVCSRARRFLMLQDGCQTHAIAHSRVLKFLMQNVYEYCNGLHAVGTASGAWLEGAGNGAMKHPRLVPPECRASIQRYESKFMH